MPHLALLPLLSSCAGLSVENGWTVGRGSDMACGLSQEPRGDGTVAWTSVLTEQ